MKNIRTVLLKIVYCYHILVYRHLPADVSKSVHEDVDRYGCRTLESALRAFRQFRNIFYFRVGTDTFSGKVCARLARPLSQIQIYCKNGCGGGLYIPHTQGCTINANKIGSNVTVMQGVTIGKKNEGIPVIEDNVTICANAIVVGNITVGHDSVIGACAFVDKDVPPYAVVAGIPARVVKTIEKY